MICGVPEGDTLKFVALALRPLVGSRVEATGSARVEPIARAIDRRVVQRVESRGKHLLVWFEDDRILHVHLRLSGLIDVHPHGRPWRRARHRAWLTLTDDAIEVVFFDGPVIELLQAASLSLHPVLRRLGPDPLGSNFDVGDVVARMLATAPDRAIADVLGDQRVIAGIGNVWKSEICFHCEINPWTPVGTLAPSDFQRIASAAATALRSQIASGRHGRPRGVYGQTGRPCPRCATSISSAPQGEGARRTYWCPSCQPAWPKSSAADVEATEFE